MVLEDLSAALPHGGQDRGRDDGLPLELAALLRESVEDRSERERSWERFVHKYSRLILHAVHARSNGYDDAMDKYAFVLERLRDDDYRRLRTFATGRRARFTTWLVVVVGRLCIDFHRRRYGSGSVDPGADGGAGWQVDLRRRLADHAYARLDGQRLGDPRQESPDLRVRREELAGALGEAFADLVARDRLLLRLRFYDDLTAKQIAEAMSFPSQFHVYRRLNKLLDGLRMGLESRGIGDPRP